MLIEPQSILGLRWGQVDANVVPVLPSLGSQWNRLPPLVFHISCPLRGRCRFAE
eukprot:COSAG05_NODE_24074_length_254_cov_0.606452_1_plen_53_part_10